MKGRPSQQVVQNHFPRAEPGLTGDPVEAALALASNAVSVKGGKVESERNARECVHGDDGPVEVLGYISVTSSRREILFISSPLRSQIRFCSGGQALACAFLLEPSR